MPEQYLEFDELKPEQALDIVAQAVDPIYLDFLRRVRIAMAEHSFRVSLFAPQSYGRGQKQISAQFQQLLQARCEAVAGRPPRMGVQLPEGALPLPEGATQLLYWTHDNKWQRELDVVAAEVLLVGIEQPDTAELIEQLRIHATYSKVNKSVTPDKAYTIFHVADDQTRGSTFSGLRAAGSFAGWYLLKSVANEDHRLFLPPDIWPRPEATAAFCRLLQNAPQLFSPQPPRSDHKLLAALIQQPESGGVLLLFLRNLFFTDQDELSPSVAGYTQFAICSLADSPQQMKQLHDEIQSLKPQVGYRLELRVTRFKERAEVERERLLREWHELNYEMELLNAYNLCRPALLRFTAAQLAAMGDYLSRLPGKTLRDGKLLYGFQATDSDPDGLHFLYVDPMVVKEPDLDPLIKWSALDAERPMRFWPDPFWAQHYSSNNHSLLFVPEFTTLFPTVHDWNVEAGEMDAYLQKIIRHWLQEQPGADPYNKSPFPQRPIYVFDGPCDPWANIKIYILDLETFRPLHTYLGWLNDNLILQQGRPLEHVMTQVASDMVWADITQQTSRRKEQIEQEFIAVSSQLTQAVAGQTAALMQTLTAKLEQIQAAADNQRQTMGELQARLGRLIVLYRQVADAAQQAEQRETDIRQQMSEFQQTDKSIQDEIELFRRQAAETIEETSRQIDRLLAELRQSYEREEQKLYDLNRSRGRR
jgi:hypothetical protein